MKVFLALYFFLLCVPGFSQSKNGSIRFDGIYQTQIEIDSVEHDTSYYYLRFYSDGVVISASVENSTIYNIAKWFNRNHKTISKGKYELTGTRLYFATTSKEGTCIYDGNVIDKYYLELNCKSLITCINYPEKYYFIKIE
jgi:hypothetical protein